MQTSATILVVDDDSDVLTAARLLLKQHFTRVLTTSNPEDIERLMREQKIDVYLLDMNFAIGRNTGDEGLRWLGRIREIDEDAVVILMTAFGDLNTAVRAMREGAADFVLKPWQNDKLLATIQVAADLRRTRATVEALSDPGPGEEMIAGSPRMREVMNVVDRVAVTDAAVLIRGENGTGKELIAQALHRKSNRAGRPMLAVDLGAIAESLFESELFGHRRGAFTGADRDRSGRIAAAHGGTLFLDEIGNLPVPLQTRLLRVLENGEVFPLGSDHAQPVDVRLVAATNQPLEQMVADGRFREDLLYRINTIEIKLPPLRERLEDLTALVDFFAAKFARKYGRDLPEIPDATRRALAGHSWPGNIRELSHAVERALILSEGNRLDKVAFSLPAESGGSRALSLNLEDNERHLVQEALDRAGGNVSHAADFLGITRSALYRRMEKFGL